MGNQPILPVCCHQILNQKTSTSSLFEKDAIRLHKSKQHHHDNQPCSIYTDEDREHAMMYYLESESSDADTDCTLSRSLLLEQSLTTLADDTLEAAVIEIETKLKQEQHAKDILKHENETLRKTLSALYKKYGVIDTDTHPALHASDSEFSTDTDVTTNYNWSVSPRSPSIAYTTNTIISTDTEEAHSVSNCISIKRIIEALQWYSKYGNDHESVYKKMGHQKYGKQIANDYEHVMRYHLEENENDNVNIQREYNLICNRIQGSVQECAFEECSGYRRYLRSRNGGNKDTNKHKAQTPKQHELQTYVNTMDGIHCCFMHLAKSLQFKQ